ncbi:hypothetical protein [Jeotgalibacillus campisalis]|uniref:Uncharacterized protein n=1 Tax=Jeotgalibacillus campisalis TaxID=220754 RepID=A0A0C2R7D9_9BACL|nr:hypothetical protein [Jeotgalibacillus campisalis]KIL46165.1 hypothetical protein KR50_28400 [Jeotgalibacillus campisalis]
MAKLKIKKRESDSNNKGICLSNYDVLIDGHEISGINGLHLSLATDEFNHCHISFFADHVEIDADTLVEFQAHIDSKAKSEKG